MSELPPRIQNYNVAKGAKGYSPFVETSKKGGSAHSFGIHVAKWQECLRL
jgi:hypothetical protein